MLDGDVDFKPEAVKRLLHCMVHPEVAIVCGKIKPKGNGKTNSNFYVAISLVRRVFAIILFYRQRETTLKQACGPTTVIIYSVDNFVR